MDFNLPSGWSVKQIKDIGKCVTGTTPKTKISEYYAKPEYDFISPADLGQNKYIYSSAKKISRKGLDVSRAVPKNTILCVCIGSSIGKVGLSWHEKSSTNQQINSVICKEQFEPHFIYYLLLFHSNYWKNFATPSTVPILNKGRFKEIRIPVCDNKKEQKIIAGVLSLVQNAIAQQEKAIALTTELKKALMQKLFTEGTRKEPQKQTEIGLIPESWELSKLEQIAESFQYGTSVKCDYEIEGKPVLRIPNVVGGYIDISDLKYGKPKKTELDTHKLIDGDLLFVRTNGTKVNSGRCSLYRGELGDDCYFASYLIRVRVYKDELFPAFLDEYTRTAIGTSFLSGQAIRTADGKFNINSGTLQRMLVPKPDVEQQVEIANIASYLDTKVDNFLLRKRKFNELFQTLLHQLMTAKIRVSELNLDSLNLDLEE